MNFEYVPGVRYIVYATLLGERKELLETQSAGIQPITDAIRKSAVLLLKGWDVIIEGDDHSYYHIQPNKGKPVG